MGRDTKGEVSKIGGLSVAAKSELDGPSCYETPQWLVGRIKEAFGGTIFLDPCTTPENPVGAVKYIAPPQDGILCPWRGRTIFINPPYGRTISNWTDKALNNCFEGRQLILLVPCRTDAKWFQRLAAAATAVIFVAGRIQFVTGSKPDNAPFPSALVGLNHDLVNLADLGIRMIRR